jgi:hypothetical protein
MSNDWLLRGFIVVVSYIRGDNLATTTRHRQNVVLSLIVQLGVS